MMANIIIGVLFFALVGYGAYKSIKSIRNNSCPGCSGGCTEQKCKGCKH